MTVIMFHPEGWIESHFVTISIPDAAGSFETGVIPVSKAGNVMAAYVTMVDGVSNDNIQTLGVVGIIRGTPTPVVDLSLGLPLTGFILKGSKTLGTAGVTVQSFNVVLFMKK